METQDKTTAEREAELLKKMGLKLLLISGLGLLLVLVTNYTAAALNDPVFLFAVTHLNYAMFTVSAFLAFMGLVAIYRARRV